MSGNTQGSAMDYEPLQDAGLDDVHQDENDYGGLTGEMDEQSVGQLAQAGVGNGFLASLVGSGGGDQDLDNDICDDLIEQMLDVIWGRNNIKRGLSERYDQMLEDSSDLYNTRRTGPHSWEGHQRQYEGLRQRLKNLLDQFFSNMCNDPQLIPRYVHVWAERPAPVRPRVQPEPQRRVLPTWDEVWEVIVVLGLSVSLVVVIIAALADPEPASKLALAGLSVAMIAIILTRLGYDDPNDEGPVA